MHPLVSPGRNVLAAFLLCLKTDLPNSEEEAGFAKNADGNQNTKIDSVICLYIFKEFSYHEVILTFGYIIRYNSLFIVAHIWYNAILHN